MQIHFGNSTEMNKQMTNIYNINSCKESCQKGTIDGNTTTYYNLYNSFITKVPLPGVSGALGRIAPRHAEAET